jgi:hypothetical protein
MNNNLISDHGARKGLIGKRGAALIELFPRGPAAVSEDKGQHVTDLMVGKTPGG